MSCNLSGSGGRSSGVNYATSAMYGRMFSSLQNIPNARRVANTLAITYQADTGAGGGSLKRIFKSIPNYNKGLKLVFSINELINYAYQHSPVVSMATPPKASLEEIITTQPLINLYDTDGTHLFYLTYIYYKTEDELGNPILNGYGYLTCNFFQDTSVRSVFTVTAITTQLLSNTLFGLQAIPIPNDNYSENVYMFNNNNGQTDHFVLSVKEVGNDRIVTIETPQN